MDMRSTQDRGASGLPLRGVEGGPHGFAGSAFNGHQLLSAESHAAGRPAVELHVVVDDSPPPPAQRAARADQVVGTRLASWSLRLGLAFVFLYAAVSSLLDPATFTGYFPSFLPTSWATELLPLFAVYEVLLALALVTGLRSHLVALLAAATLVGITAANPDAFEVLFRNVAITCAALALAAQTWPPRTPTTADSSR